VKQTIIAPFVALFAGIALCQVGNAQQPPIKRTDLLTMDLSDLGDRKMHVWIADIAPGAATGRHSHLTPRFVYVVQGSVVVEMDGKPPQTFGTGQAFVETPNAVHNFRNASTTETARALGFQYSGKEQLLQINAS